MRAFSTGDRVVIAATGERGSIEEIVPKADGPWAEQHYGVRLDGNDLMAVNLHEIALVAEGDYPDWDDSEAPA